MKEDHRCVIDAVTEQSQADASIRGGRTSLVENVQVLFCQCQYQMANVLSLIDLHHLQPGKHSQISDL